MQYHKFGSTEFEVSPLGVGCMSMSGAYGPADDAQSIATLHRAFDLGVNFLDTSSSYGSGHNHELIAKAIKGRRERIVIHSKSGSPRTPDATGIRGGGSAEYLIPNCEDSVKRLGVDALDIFTMSRIDPNVPIEESVGAMARLVEQGKTRYIGLSEASPESIRRAQKVHPIVSLQMEYSLFSRDAEAGNLQTCREFGMGFMAYGPLGHGLLTGRYEKLEDVPENRRRAPRYQAGNWQHNLKLLNHLDEFAKEKGASTSQVALAWLMAQGHDVVPIPSAKTVQHLEEDLAAIELQLSKDDLAWLNEVFAPDAPAGARSADMDRLNR